MCIFSHIILLYILSGFFFSFIDFDNDFFLFMAPTGEMAKQDVG